MFEFVFFLVIILVYLIYSKISFIKIRNGSKKISAVIAEYRKEKGPMRNDYTLLNYPYVRIEVNYQDFILAKLNYADNWRHNFHIGEKIDVFWNEDKLLYWSAYDNGIYKYLPNKIF